jgi:hypothetical protein
MLIAMAIVGGLAAPAVAQDPLDHPWRHGTTIAVLGGTAVPESADARGAFGTAVGWEINQWVRLEGTGTWIAANRGQDAFAAEFKALTMLTRPARVVPYIGGGLGLYRAVFDGAGAAMPDFYQRRMSGQAAMQRAFTDPSFVFEAGADLFVHRHLSVRPDVSVRLVTRQSHGYPIAIAAVHLAYHFEAHDAGR